VAALVEEITYLVARCDAPLEHQSIKLVALFPYYIFL
jgi:hypothetical protein